mgnify:CR=1 FL=1
MKITAPSCPSFNGNRRESTGINGTKQGRYIQLNQWFKP